MSQRTPLLIAVTLGFPLIAHADLQQEMDAMFGTMTNVTAPTAHLGQRRGVITGGSLVSRNRIANTNLVSFVPPSFSAGCGGIDLFSGSFSFINADQFVEMMRAVGANAAGYAFQLAINAMCPDCGDIMTDLQKKMQALNQLFSNSCQLAQGIVNDAASLLPNDVQSRMKMSEASFSSGVTDVFGAMTGSSKQGDPTAMVKANAPDVMQKVIQGNLVWRALNKYNAGAWFRFGGNAFLEAAMSVTGTVIVGAPEKAPDGKGESNPIASLPNILSIKDLLNGNGTSNYQTVKIYSCDTHDVDGCLHPQVINLTLVGLKRRVRDTLVGNGTSTGLIYKFATNSGTLTNDERAFMELVPTAVGAMVHNLAREDYGAARLFADEGSPVIALEMAQLMVQGMLDAVRQASSLQDHAYASKLGEVIDKARGDLEAESIQLSGRYGNTKELLAFYANFIDSTKARAYGTGQQTAGNEVPQPTP